MEYQYTEADIRNEVLRELASSSTGSLTTTQLIEKLTARLNPTGKDNEILENRSDTHFSQKVRNVVSHREQSTSIFKQGLAYYESENGDGKISITEEGKERVKSL